MLEMTKQGVKLLILHSEITIKLIVDYGKRGLGAEGVCGAVEKWGTGVLIGSGELRKQGKERGEPGE